MDTRPPANSDSSPCCCRRNRTQRHRWLSTCCAVPVIAWIALLLPETAPASEPLTFERDVRPILKTHCFHCHGEGEDVEAGLDLRLRRFLVKGGESGPAIVPGQSSRSLLFQRIASGEMPPAEDQRLQPQDLKAIRSWLDDGAATARPEPEQFDPDNYFTEEERNWWAFRPVVQKIPPVVDAEVDTPVDAFLLQRMTEIPASDDNAIRPQEFAPAADRATLIRRIYLDVLGLPPSSKDVEGFVESPRPDAWPRLIEQVLSSPRYGERWGRRA